MKFFMAMNNEELGLNIETSLRQLMGKMESICEPCVIGILAMFLWKNWKSYHKQLKFV